MAAHTERPLCKQLAVFDFGLGTPLVENLQQHGIFALAGHDDHILKVLGSGTDKGDAADVNLLDDLLVACSAGYSLLEGLEIHDDQIDGRNIIFFHLLQVALIVAAGKDASENLRMQGLHATA